MALKNDHLYQLVDGGSHLRGGVSARVSLVGGLWFCLMLQRQNNLRWCQDKRVMLPNMRSFVHELK